MTMPTVVNADTDTHSIGWPHRDSKGNCLCLNKCCLGDSGCKCRSCLGESHAHTERLAVVTGGA